jgi:peptidoglycan-associated lipoprotein
MTFSRSLTLAIFVLAATAAGCDKKATTPEAKSPAATLTRGEMQAPAVNAGALPPGMDASVKTNALHVSDEIARACDLPNKQSHASFDFDSATIDEDDKTVLAAVAKCLTEGALKDRSVSLIGRADPRGEDEYNMSLGGTRSEAVRKYLHDLGVHRDHLGATSRGELDAAGTDEAGWAKDRRVDVELVAKN